MSSMVKAQGVPRKVCEQFTQPSNSRKPPVGVNGGGGEIKVCTTASKKKTEGW